MLQDDIEMTESDDISDNDIMVSDSENEIKHANGCKHYKRHCQFVSPCCQKLFSCRICHDEEIGTHALDRHAVKEVVCTACNARQPVSGKCIKCNVVFGKYFCSICRLYDDNDKKQFHCEGCGICRVGGRNNFVHCFKCGLCLSKSIKETHKCIEKNSERNCPICLEDMLHTRQGLHVPDCGHLLHSKCFQRLLKMGDFRCPTCGISLGKLEELWKSLDKEIEETPMPPEYADTKLWILCKDCHNVSQVKFHVLGLKCSSCGSYNTCGSDPPKAEGTEV